MKLKAQYFFVLLFSAIFLCIKPSTLFAAESVTVTGPTGVFPTLIDAAVIAILGQHNVCEGTVPGDDPVRCQAGCLMVWEPSTSTLDCQDYECSACTGCKDVQKGIFDGPCSAIKSAQTSSVPSLESWIIGAKSIKDQNGNELADNGAVGTVNTLISSLYAKPPANTQQYLADLKNPLGITKTALAAPSDYGYAFTALSPLLPIWKSFRDIAYIFMVAIFLGIGFAVMFKGSLPAKTAITIQQIIPRAVITLILITFSYAIAALAVDLMYLILGLIIAVIQPSGPMDTIAQLQIGGKYAFGGWENLSLGILPIIYLGKGFFYAFNLSNILNPTTHILSAIGVGGAVNEVITAVTRLTAIGSLSNILTLILAVSLFAALFKILFLLLKSYINILLLIVFSPFQLMITAIPGQDPLQKWFRSLLANLAPFPTVIAVLAITSKIMEASFSAASSGFLWTPPMLNIGLEANLVESLLGFAMLLIIPTIIGQVQEAIKYKPDAYGKALSEALKPSQKFWSKTGQPVITGTTKTATKLGSSALSSVGRRVFPGGFNP